MTVLRRRPSPASGRHPEPTDADQRFRSRVDAALASFAEAKRAELDAISPELATFADAAIDFIAGGKRLRPLFCWAGWIAAGGDPDLPAFDGAAASLEWLGYLQGEADDETLLDALSAFIRTENFEEREQERGYLDRAVLEFMKERH